MLSFSDVNFDITKNTILDSELVPEHFEQVTKSILTQLSQCVLIFFSVYPTLILFVFSSSTLHLESTFQLDLAVHNPDVRR